MDVSADSSQWQKPFPDQLRFLRKKFRIGQDPGGTRCSPPCRMALRSRRTEKFKNFEL